MGGGKIEGTGGVTPMSIAGRLVSDRERLNGMTAEERAWRKKWLADQNLTSSEPRYVLMERKELLNPIRRLYRFPLDVIFEKGVARITGKETAKVLRFYTGRGLIGLWGIFATFYYFKYNTNTWESRGRWRVIQSKTAVYPGEPGFPNVHTEMKPHSYYDRGFKDSVLAKEFPQYQKEK